MHVLDQFYIIYMYKVKARKILDKVWYAFTTWQKMGIFGFEFFFESDS